MNDIQKSGSALATPQSRDIYHSDLEASRRVKRIISAGAFGTIVEYFDFSVYAFLATTISDVFFSCNNSSAALLYTLGVFGAAFVLRPVGGILIGHVGDRYGRKPALTFSVAGMAFASTLIGLLPSYAAIGIGAPVLLLLLRCVQGLSAGGELGSAASYVVEASPDRKRGAFTSMMNMGALIGTMCGALIVAVLRGVMPTGAFQDWGWRIPFLVSLPLGVITLILRWRMEESQEFGRIEATGTAVRVPALEALKSNPRAVLGVCGSSLVTLISFYITFAYLPTYFQRQRIMPGTAAAWSTTATLFLAALAIPLWGRLSDKVGRKPLLITGCITHLLAAYPAFVVMSHSTSAAIAAQILLGQLEALYMGVFISAYCEQFSTRVRVSGFNLGYNTAAVLAGTGPYLATWLIASTGQPLAPVWILLVAAAISLVATLTLRETANRPLTRI
ncbi:MFS transporter [Burkholderia ubonensis]|uniref:MFS transporter n=1 Tax=Burkholderia ubonensis TaxID=101571 RepID=UPI000BA5E7BA|nr:MFS transporter [Burkholderia ubonensis]PAJ85362.1 hypothetical protein CJO70_23380 [Burkholderia ubonensis]PAJ92308.1 hypothetical protein CJO69_22895 [Burkholderia ubonensis]PAK05664.1 hypothetical protein CJO67_23060 [Burkholderia ubonensis]PAK14493.1 hypothetical protein CJO66_12435 [Burkholderia ubonensis]RQP67653.1 MFS transporter [Burkholderia ubonensis]